MRPGPEEAPSGPPSSPPQTDDSTWRPSGTCEECRRRSADGPDNLCSICRDEAAGKKMGRGSRPGEGVPLRPGPEGAVAAAPSSPPPPPGGGKSPFGMCSACEIRPADGPDGLCSICRSMQSSEETGLVEVPNVVGMTGFAAKYQLSLARLVGKDGPSESSYNQSKRGTSEIHRGEKVVAQEPVAGTRVRRGSTVILQYSFTGSIEHASNDYPGEITYRDSDGRLHNDQGPAWILPEEYSEGMLYGERWMTHGKSDRTDGPSDLFVYKDGISREGWQRDGMYHREDGPAIVVRDSSGEIVYAEHWRVEDGQSVLHNDEGPAVYGERGQETVEEYFLHGENLSREDWLRARKPA